MTKEILLEKLDALWDAAEMLPEGTVVSSVSITESYGGEEPRACMRLASGTRELAAAGALKSVSFRWAAWMCRSLRTV